MTISLTPEIEQFLRAEVDAGHFPSIEAAVEASVLRMIHEREFGALDEETLAKIDAAEAAIDRGAVYDSHEAKRVLSQKLGIKFD